MADQKKKLNINLDHWFPISMYAGAVFVSLGFANLPDTAWLWRRNVTGPKQIVMLLVALVLVIDIFLDRAYLLAFRRDVSEKEKHVKNGGLHVKTLQALASPCMLILDAVLLIYISLSQGKSGTVAEGTEHTFLTIAMATGIVLWIYGRMLPRIRYKSVWGIRTKASMASVTNWGKVHLQAQPWVCLGGLIALAGGTFLPPAGALACAAATCVFSFSCMFLQKVR